jgi:Tol biopolymer transport system component
MEEVSPDGHWMVYGSDVTGRFEIYVVPFPNTKAAKSQISTLGGAWPKWSGSRKRAHLPRAERGCHGCRNKNYSDVFVQQTQTTVCGETVGVPAQ